MNAKNHAVAKTSCSDTACAWQDFLETDTMLLWFWTPHIVGHAFDGRFR